MISRLFPLLCTLALALGSTVPREEDAPIGPGKKKFDDTIVRPDVIDVNKIITTIRDNWHLKGTAEGLVMLCNMVSKKFPASESNEVFKAGKASIPLNASLGSQYLYGTYFVCPTHAESFISPTTAGINAKIFDGKHTMWNSHGAYNQPCDIVNGVPFAYSLSNSFIDKPEYPEVNPSIIVDFPFTAKEEVRSLGSVPGLGKEWDDIFVAVGGLEPNVYQYQFIAFPLTKSVCPNIKHPARESNEQPKLPSSKDLTTQKLRG